MSKQNQPAILSVSSLSESNQARLNALRPLWSARDSLGAREALPDCMTFFAQEGQTLIGSDPVNHEQSQLALGLNQMPPPKWLAKSLFDKGGLRQRLKDHELLFLSSVCALFFTGLFKIDSALFAKAVRLCGGLGVAQRSTEPALSPAIFGFYQRLAQLSAEKPAALAVGSLDALLLLSREPYALKSGSEALTLHQRYASEAVSPIEWGRLITPERSETLLALLEKTTKEGPADINPSEWAIFAIKRWAKALDSSVWLNDGAARLSQALIGCVEAAGGAAWLMDRISGRRLDNLAHEMTANLAIARLTTTALAKNYTTEQFWAVNGPHELILSQTLRPDFFHQASVETFGLPSGALSFNPLVRLLSRGAWESAAPLALAAELSSKRAAKALDAANEWAKMEGVAWRETPSDAPVFLTREGALWPKAMRKLASLAAKGNSPEASLAELASAHPIIQARLEALALMESSEPGASRGAQRRAL